MPTTVEVGADRPIIVRLALGWIQQLLDQFDGHNEIPLQTIIEGN